MKPTNDNSNKVGALHSPWRRWGARFLLAGLVVVLSIIVLWQTAYWVRQFAVADLREQKAHTLNLVVENLRGSLSKFQYQPSLLAKNAMFRAVLSTGNVPFVIETVNLELERINFLSGALDTFLLDRAGVVAAASNWATAQSYVGKNFSSAPYFQPTLQGRLGRYFATDDAAETGDISYYFAYPIRRGEKIAGAIVIKTRVERLSERSIWLSPDHETLVVDQDGIIFMSSRSDWRYRSLWKLSPDARRRLRQSRKYGDRPLSELPVTWDKSGNQVTVSTAQLDATNDNRGSANRKYMSQQMNMNEAGWRVLIFARLDGIKRRQTVALAVASFMLISVILLAAFGRQRRLQQKERIALQATAQIALETEVKERTKDLTEANTQLRMEISERTRAELELTKTQDELVQATKLAALGQMSAGLSHELNQPLAAIRSYSDNARAFLERTEPESVRTNLESISELTDRMARIIRNLRIYARNEPVKIRPVPVSRAIEEALSLLDERINANNIDIRTDLLLDDEMMVNGGEVRLQQVFVNIVSNAIDAMDGAVEKRLDIRMEERDDTVTVSVRDTGPGIPDTSANDIFDPFFSTKEVGEGMGLGLSISYGIIKQFGGQIDASNHPGGGAVFRVTLIRSGVAT